MSRPLRAVTMWVFHLVVAPPPLNSMTRSQKVARIFLVTVSLVISSILVAMAGAVVIFVAQRGQRIFASTPELVSGIQIVLAGLAVNSGCVFLLLQMKKADQKWMSKRP